MLKINKVYLNVNDLKKVKIFYEECIGLETIVENETVIEMGIDQITMLVLRYTNKKHDLQEAGLYHIAFLLPSQKALAQKLGSMIKNRVLISGAADHGYSEAIYLSDPEGNGIEIYADKSKEKWDIQKDGSIIGVTEPLDINNLLSLTDDVKSKLPIGTTIGHLHLSVINLKDSYRFFNEVLTLDLKYNLQNSAYFMSKDNYHHHFGLNIWNPMITKANSQSKAGLVGYDLEVDKITYQLILDRLNLNDIEYELIDNQIMFFDTSYHNVSVKTSF